MARFSTSEVPRTAGQLIRVDMSTGEILSVGARTNIRHVRRLVKAAQRRRARLLRAASVSSWHLSRVEP